VPQNWGLALLVGLLIAQRHAMIIAQAAIAPTS
jgi:hypothetical protein